MKSLSENHVAHGKLHLGTVCGVGTCLPRSAKKETSYVGGFVLKLLCENMSPVVLVIVLCLLFI